MAKGYTIEELKKLGAEPVSRGYTLEELQGQITGVSPKKGNQSSGIWDSISSAANKTAETVTSGLGLKGVSDYFGKTFSPLFTKPEDRAYLEKPTTKEAIGAGLQVGSVLVPGGAGLGRAGTVASRAALGAVTGATSGALYGAGKAVEDKMSLGEGAKEVLKTSLLGAGVGGVLEGGFGAIGAARLAQKRALAIKAEKDIEKLAGTIIQGKKADVPKAIRAISQIDVGDVKNYTQLKEKFADQIDAVATGLDKKLAERTEKYLPEQTVITKTVGDKDVVYNPIEQALKDLEELYTSTNDPVAVEQVRQIAKKANEEGLSILEINNLARNYGSEFGSKAFSPMGDPRTSINAQAFENTRSAVKEVARSLYGDESFNLADSALTDLLRVKSLTEKTEEAVNKISQRVTDRGLGEKIGRVLFRGIDIASGGTLKGFVQSFIPRSGGLKIMNALDLERNLNSSLIKLKQLLEKYPNEAESVKEIDKLLLQSSALRTSQPNTANAASEPQNTVIDDTIPQNGTGASAAAGLVLASQNDGQDKPSFMDNVKSVGNFYKKIFSELFSPKVLNPNSPEHAQAKEGLHIMLSEMTGIPVEKLKEPFRDKNGNPTIFGKKVLEAIEGFFTPNKAEGSGGVELRTHTKGKADNPNAVVYYDNDGNGYNSDKQLVSQGEAKYKGVFFEQMGSSNWYRNADSLAREHSSVAPIYSVMENGVKKFYFDDGKPVPPLPPYQLKSGGKVPSYEQRLDAKYKDGQLH